MEQLSEKTLQAKGESREKKVFVVPQLPGILPIWEMVSESTGGDKMPPGRLCGDWHLSNWQAVQKRENGVCKYKSVLA